MANPLPSNFKAIAIPEYTGTTNPSDHLSKFEHSALLHQYFDGVKCRVFLTTLAGPTQRWFNQFPKNAIRSFEEFSDLFLHQFSSSKQYQKTPLSLFNVKQEDKETLRDFVQRFTSAGLEIPIATPDILANAFTQGLRDSEFFKSLAKKPAKGFDELVTRAEKYINLEEARRMKKQEMLAMKSKNEESKVEQKVSKKPKTGEKERSTPFHQKYDQYIPLRISQTEALMAVKSSHLLRWPKKSKEPPSHPPSEKFCKFHNDFGHYTEDCAHLRNEIQRLIHMGYFQDLIAKGPQIPIMYHPRKLQAREMKDNIEQRSFYQDNAPTGSRNVIHMIAEGPTGEDSNRARKRHIRSLDNGSKYKKSIASIMGGPSIQFGPEDLRGVQVPHQDALVITATIANYDVARIFVDGKSSVDIIFAHAFRLMDLGETRLEPVEMPLFGFTGDSVTPLGQVYLPLSLGTRATRKIQMLKFLIVDAPFAYNVILGRPALAIFQAVASPYHMKLKFPVGNQEGEVVGEQMMSRKCYVEALRTEKVKKIPRRVDKMELDQTLESNTGHMEPVGELLTIELAPGEKDKTTKIGSRLSPNLQQDLIELLRHNVDIFTFSSADLVGIDPQVMVHSLNVDPMAKPVIQKNDTLAKRKTI